MTSWLSTPRALGALSQSRPSQLRRLFVRAAITPAPVRRDDLPDRNKRNGHGVASTIATPLLAANRVTPRPRNRENGDEDRQAQQECAGGAQGSMAVPSRYPRSRYGRRNPLQLELPVELGLTLIGCHFARPNRVLAGW